MVHTLELAGYEVVRDAQLPCYCSRVDAAFGGASYGSRYDFDDNRLLPAEPIPEFLLPLREQAARWAGVAPDAFSSALASLGVDGQTILRPGTPRNQEIGVCEWTAPNCRPAPTAQRITSGTETYPAGRYLDLDRNATGIYVIDFNRAYHPYCYYNLTFDCPYPPAENRLTVPIRAGERMRK